MRDIKYLILLLIVVLEGSCVTPYSVTFENSDEFLVVEGLVTNENRSHYVRLSRSNHVGHTRDFEPVAGASVFITDSQGNETLLTEKNPGIYYTDSTQFVTETGNAYTLRIIDDQDSYISRSMLLKEVPEIDSLYTVIETKAVERLKEPELGYQVYLDTYDRNKICDFYRWEYIETFEVRFPNNFDYEHVTNKQCWVTNKSEEILIENTFALSENIIEKRPVIFLNNDTERLSVKYSILMRQYSIDEEEYYYWETVRKTNSEQGGLYDPVPMPIRGNVESENDPSREVLGFFSVSSVAEKRLFIKNDTLIMPGFYDFCVQDTLRTLNGVEGLGIDLWCVEASESMGPVLYLMTTIYGCTDCTTRGTNVKPSFWEDL